MADRAERKTTFCASCGKMLSKANAWMLPQRIGGGVVPYCTSCMGRWYKLFAGAVGYKLAMFMCCAAFNLPYIPSLLQKETLATGEQSGNFLTRYIAELHNSNPELLKTGKFPGFYDGETNFVKLFSGDYPTVNVTDEMMRDPEYRRGPLNRIKDWGHGPEKRPYTDEDYEQLDEFYDAIADGRPYISPQTDMAIRTIAMMRLEQRYCLNSGEYGEAKKLGDIIKVEMEGEQLRKKDELPQDKVRLDDIVLACERAGLTGKSYDELVEILAKKMFHTPYGYTRDAADQMLLYIVNATRFNEGYQEVDRLPDSFAIKDEKGEFAPKPDAEEKSIYQSLKIVPLQMGGKGG